MFERVLLGVGRRMVPVPEWVFRPMVQRDSKKLARRQVLLHLLRQTLQFLLSEYLYR